MNTKTKLTAVITFLTLSLLAILIPEALANIEVKNPLNIGTVDELSTSIRSRLMLLVGGLGILFVVIAGIIYIIAGINGSEETATWAKKGLFGAVAGTAIIVGGGMILYEIYYIVGGEGLDIDGALSAREILKRLIDFLLAIIGFLFLIAALVGGIMYLTSAGDQSKADLGKKTFQYGVIGITIALASLIIIDQIDKIVRGGAA